MNYSYNLNNILSAIDDINNKKKEKPFFSETKNSKKTKTNSSENEEILPITEKIILEAEEYSNKLKDKPEFVPSLSENILLLDNEYIEQNLKTVNLKKTKQDDINDLYNPWFKLNEKINNLENEIKILNSNKIDEDILHLNDTYISNENEEHLINEVNLQDQEEHLINEVNLQDQEEHLINEENSQEREDSFFRDENGDISEEVIKTIKFQDTLIKNFEKQEDKLRLKIVDLEQNIILFNNKKTNINDNLIVENKINETIFYKDNYERLIIENNDINKKLINTKKQITTFEENIKELEFAFIKISNILSKSTVVNIDKSALKTLNLKPSDKAFSLSKSSMVDTSKKDIE